MATATPVSLGFPPGLTLPPGAAVPIPHSIDPNKYYLVQQQGNMRYRYGVVPSGTPGAILGSDLASASKGALKIGPGVGGGIGGVQGVGGIGDTVGIFGAIADAITSSLDFLKLIAWVFHPRNLLRAVEFLTGMIFIGFGAWAALQARGEAREGFTTGEAAISRSGLGRVARELGAASRGKGSGQSGRRPAKPAAAPHRERRTALRVRYQREQNVANRRTKARRQHP